MPETVHIHQAGGLCMDDPFSPPSRRELVWTLVALAAAVAAMQLVSPLLGA